jgi:transcriptional regulator with XRE-family HTH domain
MPQPVATKIGRRLSDVIAEREARDPEFARSKHRTAPGVAIANAVTLARVRTNMTQAQLAALIGTTDSAVSRLESGRHVPSLETVQRVSDALGVAFDFRVRPEREVRTEIALGMVETGRTRSRPGTHLVVSPGPIKGTWTVRKDAAVVTTEPTQMRAIDYARKRLLKGGGLLVTHRSTGEIREVREVKPAVELDAQTG